MEEDLAEKVELKVSEASTPPLELVAVELSSTAEFRTVAVSARRVPLRMPLVVITLCIFGLFQLAVGVQMRCLTDRPLQAGQRQLIAGDTYAPPQTVAVAKRAISIGEPFSSENVSIEPRGERNEPFAVRYSQLLWGRPCASAIPAGALIDARTVGLFYYEEGRQSFLVATRPVKAGKVTRGNGIQDVCLSPATTALPPGALLLDDVRDFELLQDLLPGDIVLKSQVRLGDGSKTAGLEK